MSEEPTGSVKPTRTRPKPGERRVQILQTLAMMLQQPGAERVTTAALAKRLDVSEAALYRHFASKAQMFEGLIDFIERSIFSLINQITTQEQDGLRQLRAIMQMLLAFAEKNPGMTRVLVGDALINEDPRLQGRINQITERLETSLKQSVRNAMSQQRLPADTEPGARASLILSYVMGRWLLYAKSDFKRVTNDGFDHAVALLLNTPAAQQARPAVPGADAGNRPA
ncbi:MAG: nucleoid occlusion factor SlmA [Burkholderiaceae bacterium]